MSPVEQFILDLPACTANGFRAARGIGEGWVDVEYETDNLRGTGIAAGAGSGAGELVLDLGLRGAYTLHLALGAQTSLRVWLDGDPGYHEFTTEHGGRSVQECRWRNADLTGKRLRVALQTGPAARPAFLAYVRAVPEADPYPSQRNLVATNDGWSWVAFHGIESERDVWRFFEPLRESDFGLMLWGPGGADVTAGHATRVGTLAPGGVTHAYRACDRTHATHLKRFIDGGGDILRTAVRAARDVGVRIHFYIRPEAFGAPFPYDGTFTSRFLAENRDLLCRDASGDEILRLSYAYPQVQDHMIEYFEELLDYGPDGLCFAFNRSLPMMICEPPVLDEFQRQQGRRPKLPDEGDREAMIAARISLMNGFLTRVRDLLRSRGLELSCIVPPDEQDNRVHGLALDELVQRGIFDDVMVHNGGFHANSSNIRESAFWRSLQAQGPVRVYPNGWGGSYDHRETATFLKENVFAGGFSGAFFWDTENLNANPYNWHVVRHGGTMPFLEGTIAGAIPSPRIVPLTRVRGVKLGRYNPGRSY